MKTLIVEDDFTCRLILQKRLAGYGECHIATNGAEAVSACRLALEAEEPYDLVCLDIMMPVMDGQQALKAIRAIEKARGGSDSEGVKVIMTTTVSDRKNVLQAAAEGCKAYLVKPIDAQKLKERLAAFGLIGG